MATMNKKEVDLYFELEYLPSIREKEAKYRVRKFSKDVPLRCASYNAMLDTLCRDTCITPKQAATYSIPKRWI